MSSTGQIVGGVVGAIVGFIYGGGIFGAVQGAAIGSGIGGYIDPPPGPNIRLPQVDDKTFQSAAYGVALPILYGSVGTMGNVIWLENNKLRREIRKNKTEGKGGSEGTYETEAYLATFAVSLGEARAGAQLKRIWLGGQLWYNMGSEDTETVVESVRKRSRMLSSIVAASQGIDDDPGPPSRGFFFYDGTQSDPDPRMESSLGIGNCPSYEGTMYIVFYDLDLGPWGNGLQGCPVKAEIVDAAGEGAEVSPFQVNEFTMLGSYLFGWQCSPNAVVAHTARWESDPDYPDADEFGRVEAAYSYSTATYSNSYALRAGRYGRWSEDVDYIEGMRGISNGGGEYWGSLLNGGSPRLYFTNKGGIISCYDYGVVEYYTPNGNSRDNVVILTAPSIDPEPPNTIYVPEFSGGVVCAATQNRNGTEIYVMKMINPGTGVGRFVNVLKFDRAGLLLGEWSSPALTSATNANTEFPQNDMWLDDATGLLYLWPHLSVHQLMIFDTKKDEFKNYLLTLTFDDNFYMQRQSGTCPTWTVTDGILCVCASAGSVGRVMQLRFNVAVTMFGADERKAVADIVRDRCNYVGITDDFLDLDDIDDDEVIGYRIVGPTAARAALAPLQLSHFFDLVERGYSLTAVKRGGSSIATISQSDLNARSASESHGIAVMRSREMDAQLPSRYSITYIDYGREYEPGVQYADYPTRAVNERTEQVAVVLEPSDAAKIADILINLAWMERDQYTFSLPQTFLHLQPADIITVEVSPGINAVLRIESRAETAAQTIDITARAAEPSVYVSSAVGAGGITNDGLIGYVGPAELLLLDIPLILESTDVPGYAAVMWGPGSRWPGGTLLRSVDNDQSFSPVQSFAAAGTVGTVQDASNVTDCFVTDRESVLVVDVIVGDFYAITEQQMLTGRNWCAYGQPGRWELLCYADAELQMDGTIELSTLLRGLQGTEWAALLHEDDDYIVLLDDPDNAFIASSLATLGMPILYRAITAGLYVEDSVSEQYTYAGVNLMPLSPVNIESSRTGEDWNFSWTPRSRYPNTQWVTGVAPANESPPAFEVDILDGDDVVRTIATDFAAVQYTGAQQIEDFGYAKSVIRIKIYQMSARVGRGFPADQFIGEPLPLGNINFLMLPGSIAVGDEIEFVMEVS